MSVIKQSRANNMLRDEGNQLAWCTRRHAHTHTHTHTQSLTHTVPHTHTHIHIHTDSTHVAFISLDLGDVYERKVL